MGFFKKLFGTAAVTGAAVGGALYVKKRKEERESNESIFEDFDDSRAFDVQKDDSSDGTTKVTLTINKRKVKNMADNAADMVLETSDKIKDAVSEKIGEDNINIIKDKMETAKEKVYDAADMAKDKLNDAKYMVVEKVGEDKIDAAKEKVSEVAGMAKDKVSETINKVAANINAKTDFEDDLFEDDVKTEDDVTVEDTDKEDAVDIFEDEDEMDDDFLEDELKDL